MADTKKAKKREFVRLDLNKEFSWTPSDEMDCEQPIKFIFNALSSRENALYDSRLFKNENGALKSDQEVVNYDIVKDKTLRIENINIEGKIQTITEITDEVLDYFDSLYLSEYASYIRVISTFKGKTLEDLKKQ